MCFLQYHSGLNHKLISPLKLLLSFFSHPFLNFKIQLKMSICCLFHKCFFPFQYYLNYKTNLWLILFIIMVIGLWIHIVWSSFKCAGEPHGEALVFTVSQFRNPLSDSSHKTRSFRGPEEQLSMKSACNRWLIPSEAINRKDVDNVNTSANKFK